MQRFGRDRLRAAAARAGRADDDAHVRGHGAGVRVFRL